MGLCHCYKKQPWLRCHTSQIQIRFLSLAHFPDSTEMASSRTTVALVAVMAMIFVVAERGAAQNCGCSSDLCCSQYGYCGTGDDYCGKGCREGPCYSSSSGGSVASIITNDVFNQMVSPASGCEGSGFYTYSGFIDAANAFSSFGTSSDDTTNKRELAAFFANAAHETGSFCYINERNPTSDYCDSSNTQYPCVSGQSYHGRGPLQLSWNYNYGAAGSYLSFDGLNNPGIVATDSGISWKTAVWFWMKDSNCHNAMVSGSGFGATIQAINSGECNGGNTAEVNDRVDKYKSFCSILGVDPGSNLSC